MQNLGTLKVTTPAPREVVLTRIFNTPAQLVFDALTKPDMLKNWFGPRGHQLTVCEVDLRVGGAWRYVILMPNGQKMGMAGEYREIAPPGRLVHTERFIADPDADTVGCDAQEQAEALVTTVLTEVDGKTTMVTTIAYPSQDVRDAVIASGMEHGAAESYDRMAELIESA